MHKEKAFGSYGCRLVLSGAPKLQSDRSDIADDMATVTDPISDLTWQSEPSLEKLLCQSQSFMDEVMKDPVIDSRTFLSTIAMMLHDFATMPAT